MESFSYWSARSLLRPGTGLSDVEEYATSSGWERIRQQERDPAAGLQRKIAWRVASEVCLFYTEDDDADCAFVYVGASWKSVGEGFYQHAREHLPVYEPQEVIAGYRRPGGGSAKNLLRAVLAAPREYDETVFDIVAEAMRSPDRQLRAAAVYATSYNLWAEYLPKLRQVASSDPDEEIRSDADMMIEIYRESGTGES